MNRIAIDFAPRTLRRILYQTGLLTWLCAFAGLALCIVAALTVHALIDKIDAQDAALRRVKITLGERNDNQPVVKNAIISDGQAASVNGAIAQLNLPWRDVFDAVEAATPKTVALLTLEPDAKRNLMRVMAEARNSDDMIAYIEQLKKQTFFTSVLLTKHEINEQDPNKPLRFQFEAQWAGGAQ